MPAVSPIDGQDPAFRLYYFEPNSLVLSNFQQYRFNLTNVQLNKTDQDASASWYLDYNFFDDYKLPLSPLGIYDLYQAFQSEKNLEAFIFYYKNTQSPLKNFPVTSNISDEFCVMTQLISDARKACFTCPRCPYPPIPLLTVHPGVLGILALVLLACLAGVAYVVWRKKFCLGQTPEDDYSI